MPKISVIMSVYNDRMDFLRKSIESILNQTFTDFEFLIVDDGSSNEAPEILKSYVEKDGRIFLIKNNVNLELTKSLNIAIKKSRGEYIARMDSDDIAFADRLEKQLDFLEKNNFDLIGSNCDFINENEEFLKEKNIIPPKNFRKKLFKGNFFTHSTFFGKRKVFAELYNESFKRAQDYEFLLRTLSKNYKLGYMPEKILKYRLHNQGFSAKSAKEQELSALKARLLAIKNYGYSPLYLIYFLQPILSFLLPYQLKKFIIYKLMK